MFCKGTIFISDIHGNLPALESVFADFKSKKVYNIVCLGDIVGYGPQINEVCEFLISHNVFTIKGNHDSYLLGETKNTRSSLVAAIISKQSKIITSSNKAWLRSLPKTYDDSDCSFRHGGWLDTLEEYFNGHFDYFNGRNEKIFASGHTHIPRIIELKNKYYLNPGSIGFPRDGDWRPSYIYLDLNGHPIVNRVEYDLDSFLTKVNKSYLPFERYKVALTTGSPL